MMAGSACASSCCASALIPKSTPPIAVVFCGNRSFVTNRISRLCVRVSMFDSSSSSSDFTKRMEQAWLISQQPRPVVCSSCSSKGHIECKWCGGTGFFVLGDNMLCEVPSRNTSCIICSGQVQL
ncbi:Tsi1-interacting protein TSIP1 [Medicago truncatula]|uniref:Tsi1-interacting protein TSIP1 n=1 Tax=Medicago truncatula TaxID=3880 RepID=A0A072V260_MEDTR|nr:Tsi1-interacting protein TSIP1 [Medicago truncatula]